MQLNARRNAACIAAAVVFGISLTDLGSAVDSIGQWYHDSFSTQTWNVCCFGPRRLHPSYLIYYPWNGREGNAASTMIFDGETDRRWRTELFSVIAVTAMRGICGSRLREIRALAY